MNKVFLSQFNDIKKCDTRIVLSDNTYLYVDIFVLSSCYDYFKNMVDSKMVKHINEENIKNIKYEIKLGSPIIPITVNRLLSMTYGIELLNINSISKNELIDIIRLYDILLPVFDFLEVQLKIIVLNIVNDNIDPFDLLDEIDNNHSLNFNKIRDELINKYSEVIQKELLKYKYSTEQSKCNKLSKKTIKYIANYYIKHTHRIIEKKTPKLLEFCIKNQCYIYIKDITKVGNETNYEIKLYITKEKPLATSNYDNISHTNFPNDSIKNELLERLINNILSV